MTLGLINANPVVHAKERVPRADELHLHAVDPLDIYDFVKDIRNPEHPYSLEQLSVLSEESIARPYSDNLHANYPALQYGNSNRFMPEG